MARTNAIGALGPFGACAYVAGAGVSLPWDLPLIGLAACGLCTSVIGLRDATSHRTAASRAVLLFLGVTALSILTSRDVTVSLQLSAPLLPGALLFSVIAEHFRGTRDVRRLYVTFSALSLALALWLLWNAWRDGWVSPNEWVRHAHTPLLVVGNDVTFLSIVAPLSLALLYRQTQVVVRALAGLSLLFTAVVLGLFQSRGAVLTLIASVGCTALLLRPRWAASGIGGLAVVVVLVDACLGFPLIAKFGDVWNQGLYDSRFGVWHSAGRLFQDAPWLGQGPHTVIYATPDHSATMRWSHNLYLELLVEQGLLGLAALASVLLIGLWQAWTTHSTAQDDARILNAAALAALAAFCVAAIWETSLLRLWAATVLFVVLGVISQLSASTRD